MKSAGYIFVLLFTIANAFEYLLIKASILDAYTTGIIMFGTAGVLLTVMVFVRRNKRPEYFHIPIKKSLVIGIISFFINLLLLKGLDFTTATNASILGKTDIAFSLLLSRILLNEKVSKRTLVSVLIMVAGIYLVMKVRLQEFSRLNPGDLMVILSAVLLAFNAFQVRTVLHSSGSFEIAAINCLINVIGFVIMYMLSGAYTQNPSIASMKFPFFAGFFTFLFFCGYYPSLRRFPLWKVRALALLTPIFTVLGELLFFGFHITHAQIGGMALAVAGIFGIILSEKTKAEVPKHT